MAIGFLPLPLSPSGDVPSTPTSMLPIYSAWQQLPSFPIQKSNLNPAFEDVQTVQVDNPSIPIPENFYSIYSTWLPLNPPPRQKGLTSPGIPGQSVNNPPALVRQPLFPPSSWIQPQEEPFSVQPAVVVTASQTYGLPWLSTVLLAWQPALIPPQQKLPLNPAFSAVQVDDALFGELIVIWEPFFPPLPLPVQALRRVPQSTVVTADVPPIPIPENMFAATQAWTPPSSSPIQAPRRTPPAATDAPPIPVPENMFTVFQTWLPPAPPPVQATKLNPALKVVQVDNPPVSVPENLYASYWKWIPPDPSPKQLTPLNPALEAVQVDNPPSPTRQRMSDPIPDPFPQQLREMSLGIPGQSIDNPPIQRRQQPLSVDDIRLPQQSPKLIQTTVTFNPSPPTWETGVLRAWILPDPPPQQQIRLNPSLEAVREDAPSPKRDFNLSAILRAWVPPDPLPVQAIKYQVQAAIITTTIPYTRNWLSTIETAWQQPDPLPQQMREMAPSLTAVREDTPNPRRSQQLYSSDAWVLPQKSPQLISSVDNPPNLRRQPTFTPDPQVKPWVSKYVVPAVAVNPAATLSWLQPVLRSWVLLDPIPQVRRFVPLASIDNPPAIQLRQHQLQTQPPQPWMPHYTPRGAVQTAYIRPWLDVALRSWQPFVPQPQQARLINPEILSFIGQVFSLYVTILPWSASVGISPWSASSNIEPYSSQVTVESYGASSSILPYSASTTVEEI